jgi:hypothetical protein
MIRGTDSAADPVARAFAILDSVSQPNTRWSIVYDPTTGTVYYHTDPNRTLGWLMFSHSIPLTLRR